MRAACFIFFACSLLAQQSYEDLFLEGARLTARGDYSEAIVKYESAVRLRPDAAEAHANLSVVYHAAGRYKEAVAAARDALRIQPQLVSPRIILGLSLIRLQRPSEAIPELEQVLAASPAQRDALLGLAAARVALNDLHAAVQIYQRELEHQPQDKEALYGMGICYERLAEAGSRKLSQLPDGAIYFNRLVAEHLIDRGAARLAELTLAESAGEERSARSATAAALYKEVRALAGQSRGAFERLVEFAPDSWQSQLFLGDVARQERNFEAAIRHYQNAARLEPGNPAPVLGLGTVYWELGQNEQASAFLNRAARSLPSCVQAWFALGDIAIKEHRYDDAVILLERCLRLAPDHAGAHAALGKAYFHLKRYDEAIRHLERGSGTDTYGDIHYQLGQALRAKGSKAEAARAFQESKRLRERQLGREERLKHTDQ